MKSEQEQLFASYLTERHIKYEREVQLIPDRKFRVDFFIPDKKIVVEIEGGIWASGKGKHIPGAHSIPTIIEKDCEKSNLLQMLGYKVYRIPTTWFRNNYDLIIDILTHICAF